MIPVADFVHDVMIYVADDVLHDVMIPVVENVLHDMRVISYMM